MADKIKHEVISVGICDHNHRYAVSLPAPRWSAKNAPP
jgi:hypothetical protein